MNAAQKFLKKTKVLLSKHMNEKKEKQPYCQHGESLNGRDRRSNQTPHSLKPKPSPEQGPNSLMQCQGGEEVAEI